jgi:hypothetical protein
VESDGQVIGNNRCMDLRQASPRRGRADHNRAVIIDDVAKLPFESGGFFVGYKAVDVH